MFQGQHGGQRRRVQLQRLRQIRQTIVGTTGLHGGPQGLGKGRTQQPKALLLSHRITVIAHIAGADLGGVVAVMILVLRHTRQQPVFHQSLEHSLGSRRRIGAARGGHKHRQGVRRQILTVDSRRDRVR